MFNIRSQLLILVAWCKPGRSKFSTQTQSSNLQRPPANDIKTVTTIPVFHGDSLEKRDDSNVCGYCCGHSTIACNRDAACKVSSYADPYTTGFYGYCSTTSAINYSLYKTAVDYSSYSICWPYTTCWSVRYQMVYTCTLLTLR